jgi:hypothetical protein
MKLQLGCNVKPSDNLKIVERLGKVSVCDKMHTICKNALSDIEGNAYRRNKINGF